MVEVGRIELPSKKHGMGDLHRLGPLVVTSRGKSRTTHIEDLPPDLGRGSEATSTAHPVPPSGRPKSPVGRFYESATRRSRFLACCLRLIKQQGPVRSYRWQFCLGGLIRGPSVQPPPAPHTPEHNLSKPVTPRAPPKALREGTRWGDPSMRRRTRIRNTKPLAPAPFPDTMRDLVSM